jgi:hypothetical protein
MDEPTPENTQTVSRYGVGGRHTGYKLCPYCGAANSITQTAIVKALDRGMKSQEFELVAKTTPPGTIAGMLAPLYKLFHDKGWKVRKI